jgi:glycosyltransferase involved in cell wall biosynthesis
MRICFASAEGFDGCVTACRNSAAVLGGTWAASSPLGQAPEVLAADLLILSSWHESYEALLAGRRAPTVLRWHSTVLQTEQGQEAAKIARVVQLLDRGAIAALAVDDPEFELVLGRDAVVYLPDVLDAGEYAGAAPVRLAGVNVSLFGADHWRKNLFVQSAAFNLARVREARGTPWTLHLAGQTDRDNGYAEWLQAARIPYVDHSWLNRREYLALAAAMDAGLCATLCESFGYAAADHVALGVPVVASPAIACLGDEVARCRPDSVEAVAAALSSALADRSTVAARQRQSLACRARRNAEHARIGLAELVSRARSWAPT